MKRHGAASSASDESEGDVTGRLRLLGSLLDDDLDHEGAIQWDALTELIKGCICAAPSVQARREIEQAVARSTYEIEREEEQPRATKTVRAHGQEHIWQRFAARLNRWGEEQSADSPLKVIDVSQFCVPLVSAAAPLPVSLGLPALHSGRSWA